MTRAAFLISIAIVLAGQWMLTYHRASWQLAVGLWLAGGGVLSILRLRLPTGMPVTPDRWEPTTERIAPWRLAVLSGALVGSSIVGRAALVRPDDLDFTDLTAFWLLAILVTAVAFGSTDSWRRDWSRVRALVRSDRGELLAVAVTVATAFAVRVWHLGRIPANLSGDEGTWGCEGLALLDGRIGNPFETGWFGFHNLSFMPWGLSAKLLGNTTAALRLPSVLLGTCAVLATYLLARELWDRRLALAAAALLAFGHFHMHYSRLAVNNIFDTVVAPLAFWLLVRGLRLRRDDLAVSAGLVLGLGWYAYLGARVASIVAVAYVAFRCLGERGFLRTHWRRILLVGLAALVVMLPLLMVYADRPHLLTERSNQVGIFSSGWLEREVGYTGRGVVPILADQFRRALLGFHYTLDRVFWYYPSIPLLDFVSATLLTFGLAWSPLRRRDHGTVLIVLWLALAVFFGWMITENPPSSMRLVIAAPALALIAAWGLRHLTEMAGPLFGASDRRIGVVAAGVVVIVCLLNLHFYFSVYTPKRVFGNPDSEIATVLAGRLDVDDPRPVYLFGPPLLYWEFGTFKFLVPEVDGRDVPPEDEEPDFEFDVSRGARFVAMSERRDELEAITERYPGGVESTVTSTVDDRLLYVMYDLPAAAGARSTRER
jgi:hypothetical protein